MARTPQNYRVQRGPAKSTYRDLWIACEMVHADPRGVFRILAAFDTARAAKEYIRQRAGCGQYGDYLTAWTRTRLSGVTGYAYTAQNYTGPIATPMELFHNRWKKGGASIIL